MPQICEPCSNQVTKQVFAVCAAGVVVTMAALLSSCGSDSARSAAEEELPADEVVVIDDAGDSDSDTAGDSDADLPDAEESDTDANTESSDPTGDADAAETRPTSSDPKNLAEAIVQSVNRGVRICLENNSSKKIYGYFTVYDRSDQEFDMAKGDDLCGEGATTFDSDVKAEVVGKSSRIQQYVIEGHNPWLGKPFVTLYTPYSGRWPGYLKVGDLCMSNSGWGENETRTWDDGVLKVAVTRKIDSKNFKEFVVGFSDTTSPDSGSFGSGNQCSAGDYP